MQVTFYQLCKFQKMVYCNVAEKSMESEEETALDLEADSDSDENSSDGE
jgi:hypothetical protein